MSARMIRFVAVLVASYVIFDSGGMEASIAFMCYIFVRAYADFVEQHEDEP